MHTGLHARVILQNKSMNTIVYSFNSLRIKTFTVLLEGNPSSLTLYVLHLQLFPTSVLCLSRHPVNV